MCFVLGGEKLFRSGEGKGIRGWGGGGEGKITGERKLKERKKKKEMERGKKEDHGIELSSHVSISNLLLKSKMPYQAPTVTLNIQCEQF